LSAIAPARASSTYLNVLTADQLRELDVMVFLAHPYSVHLSEGVDGDAAPSAVRHFTTTDIEKLRGAIAHLFNLNSDSKYALMCKGLCLEIKSR
jgi:hypothetical protein